MSNVVRSTLIIAFLVLLQLAVYGLALERVSSRWGATATEASMPMPGDALAPFIASTRAITIEASQDDVWSWLVQLGADRGGFFSYTFIEQALGYISQPQERVGRAFSDIQMGDLVRGSIDESKSLIVYNFPVVAVEPGESFVLENWGAFQLRKADEKQTRLLIRTHGIRTDSWLAEWANYLVAQPLHHVMERRTLMGIKARAEAGEGQAFSHTSDLLWFMGVIASGLVIGVLVFVERGAAAIVLPLLFSTIWLLYFLLLEPIPVYTLGLFAVVTGLVLRSLKLTRRPRVMP